MAYNNGININYGYDLDKNITSLVNSNAQGSTLNSFEYSYDNNGNQLTKIENGQTAIYTYDELSRLETVLYPELGLETYTYDNAGNRKSKMLDSNTTTYNYDDNNRLIQSAENGIITIYNYDNNGNLLEEAVNGTKTLYTYDGFDKLTETVKPDGKWHHNEYNAEGLRVSTEENGFRYDFVFDQGSIITELNANTQQNTRSIRGIGLIGQEDSKGNLNYYLNNAHGDVVSLVDSAGQVLNSYQYDAFGNTTNYAEKVANKFMYAGEQFDRITGQYYLRARYYNPVIGRFTQEDTYKGDGLNLYAYVANNPLKYVDPSGYCKDDSNSDKSSSEHDLFLRMENGESVIWDRCSEDLLAARDKFEQLLEEKGWSITYTSAYRPLEYQQHLYDIVQHVNKGEYANEKEKQYYLREKKKHGLSTVVAKPNPNAPHTKGIAFDAIIKDENGKPLNSFKSIADVLLVLAKKAGLVNNVKDDRVHFQLSNY